MQTTLGKHDVWSWAMDHMIRIVKRQVYVQPVDKKYGLNFRHVGTLERGLSTNEAWRQVMDAYSK